MQPCHEARKSLTARWADPTTLSQLPHYGDPSISRHISIIYHRTKDAEDLDDSEVV